jgi:preprotein translocase subunit SecD
VAVYLLFFYRVLGAVAIGALLIFGVLMLGLITVLGEVGFSLTLAGVAGIIVSIGITADSSIIFFERLRDEVNLGKTVRTAAQKAFASAFSTNLTGNTTTLAAAIILYFLAVGPVRGFALTLGMATILDILIMYFYSRPMVGLLAAGRRIGRRSVRASEPATVAGGAR